MAERQQCVGRGAATEPGRETLVPSVKCDCVELQCGHPGVCAGVEQFSFHWVALHTGHLIRDQPSKKYEIRNRGCAGGNWSLGSACCNSSVFGNLRHVLTPWSRIDPVNCNELSSREKQEKGGGRAGIDCLFKKLSEIP